MGPGDDRTLLRGAALPVRRAIITLALLSAPALAGAELIEVVPWQARMSKRVLFVVDCSGSMEDHEFGLALKRVEALATQNFDEWDMGVIGFDSVAHRWPGVPEKGVAKGWARLPSADAVQQATAWLRGVGTGGLTHGTAAFTAALSDPMHDLTVVVLTDGEFNGPTDRSLAATIKALQARRSQPAQILFLAYSGVATRLPKLAQDVGAGLYRDEDE